MKSLLLISATLAIMINFAWRWKRSNLIVECKLLILYCEAITLQIMGKAIISIIFWVLFWKIFAKILKRKYFTQIYKVNDKSLFHKNTVVIFEKRDIKINVLLIFANEVVDIPTIPPPLLLSVFPFSLPEWRRPRAHEYRFYND